MQGQVTTHKASMFTDSTKIVKEQLDTLVATVRDKIVEKSDEVYRKVKTDSGNVSTGIALAEGQLMPNWSDNAERSIFGTRSTSPKLRLVART